MKKIFLIPVLVVIILSACNSHKADKNNFVIHGKLTDSKRDSIYLKELTVKNMVSVDSTVINDDGEFYFKVKPKESSFYLLKLKKNNFITLLIESGENVEITGSALLLKTTYTVNGSKGSLLIKELNDHSQINYDKVDSLGKVYTKSKGSPDILKIKASLDSIYKGIFVEQKKYLKNFIDKNTSSLACIIAVYQQFGREYMFNINSKEDFVYFEKLDNALMKAYPDNQHVKDMHERIAEVKKIEEEQALAEAKLSTGAQAPDFTLQTPEGKSVSLSSFKGKNVLLDFWASWCAPCRAMNPKMVKLYKKFKGKNFTILSVSFDRDKDSWTKAITLDNLTWTQVSDLQYWNSPVAKLYAVQAIPYSILIDKEGKIVAKGLHGDSLTDKVAEIVK